MRWEEKYQKWRTVSANRADRLLKMRKSLLVDLQKGNTTISLVAEDGSLLTLNAAQVYEATRDPFRGIENDKTITPLKACLDRAGIRVMSDFVQSGVVIGAALHRLAQDIERVSKFFPKK